MKQPTLADWLARQEHSHPQAIDLDLTRVREVARRLGLIPWAARAILVGGTNGKGSTASMIAALARAAQVRTGLFTSPHLRRYQERIAIDGDPVDDASLLAAFADIEVARGSISLTFFEWNSLAALWIFRRQQVELAVLEVGLGGRLDATNIVDADVAVLCSVGIDHREWLGPDRDSIGREKAGIFRDSKPAVLASADMPESVIEVAQDLRAQLHIVGRDYRFSGEQPWHYHSAELALSDLAAPGIAGPRQIGNAAAAIRALELLGVADRSRRYLPDRRSVSSAIAGLRLPGRLQTVAGQPPWLLDVAHNADAAAVLAEHLRSMPCTGRRRVLFGLLADKDVESVTAVLEPLVDSWVLTSIADSPRGLSHAQLRARMPEGLKIEATVSSVAAGCETLRATAAPQDLLIVCGSFHMVGPALDWLGL